MHFEWSCALKATGLMVGGFVGLIALALGIAMAIVAIEKRAKGVTGGVATKVGNAIGRGIGISFFGLVVLGGVALIWWQCYTAVCPMARMQHAKAAPAVAEAKPVTLGTPQEGTDR